MKRSGKSFSADEHRQAPLHAGGVDLRDVAHCTSLKLQRATRRTTQAFNSIISGSGLTGNQFGLLAQLHGAQQQSKILSLGELAERVGMDPTTLTRTLKPLEKAGLVSSEQHPNDARVRCLRLTKRGQARVYQAAPLWKLAQENLRKELGFDTIKQLDQLLDKLTLRFES